MIPLTTILSYLKSVEWCESGNFSRDMTSIVNVLQSDLQDARTIAHAGRQSIAMLIHWQYKIGRTLRYFENELLKLQTLLEGSAKRNLNHEMIQVRQKSLLAQYLLSPEYVKMNDSVENYKEILGLVEGLLTAFEPSLIVAESSSARRQEALDGRA